MYTDEEMKEMSDAFAKHDFYPSLKTMSEMVRQLMEENVKLQAEIKELTNANMEYFE